MQHHGALPVPASGRQGQQLSTKLLAEDETQSGFQTPEIWAHACTTGSLDTCVWLGTGSLQVL